MRVVFALLCMLALSAAAPVSEDQAQFLFVAWMKQHNKVYQHDEFFIRYERFKENLIAIDRYNSENPDTTLVMNHLGDLSYDEFKEQYLGYNNIKDDYKRSQNTEDLDDSSLPDSVDWRTKDVLTPAKNQGQCGSCWSFSTTGSVEAINAINTGNLVSLSEQQLVDCSTSYGNQGCNGGLMDSAFEYIIHNGGLCTESSYPYSATGPNQCQSCDPVVKISSYKDVQHNSEKQLMAAVAQQPVSIAVEADQLAFQFYGGGVLTGTCGANLDHGVLVVGYGSHDGTDMWIVKNSWGASWGNNGYLMIERGSGDNDGQGKCGILAQPSYPIQ